MFGKTYKTLLAHAKYIDLPDYAVEHLFFGNETRLTILHKEIFFLKKEIQRVEAYLVPLMQDLIKEKKKRIDTLKK